MGNGNTKKSTIQIQSGHLKFINVAKKMTENDATDFVLDNSIAVTPPTSPRQIKKTSNEISSRFDTKTAQSEQSHREDSQGNLVKRIDVTHSLSYWRRPDFKQNRSAPSLSIKKFVKTPVQQIDANSQHAEKLSTENILPIEDISSEGVFIKQGFYRDRPNVMIRSNVNVRHMKLIRTSPPMHAELQSSIEPNSPDGSHTSNQTNQDKTKKTSFSNGSKKIRPMISFNKSIVPSREKIFNLSDSTSSIKEANSSFAKINPFSPTTAFSAFTIGVPFSPASSTLVKSQLINSLKSTEATFKLKEQITRERLIKLQEDSKLCETPVAPKAKVRQSRAERKWMWKGAHGVISNSNL